MQQKEILFPLSVPPFSPPLISSTRKQAMCFQPLQIACSDHFIGMDSHSLWSFVTGFFQMVYGWFPLRVTICQRLKGAALG